MSPTDASALDGLLDRASHAFCLARTLGDRFEQEFREQSPVLLILPGEASPRQRHRDTINEFIAALQDLREATKNPPDGFAPVADVLRRTAETARLMATSPHWDPYDSWPYLNQHAQDGRDAVKAARAAMPKEDPWDFNEPPAATESTTAEAAGDDLIARLLAGPEDVELTLRELALLGAHLQQRVSMSAVLEEKRASEGHSPTQANRAKLATILAFNRNLRTAAGGEEPQPVESSSREQPGNDAESFVPNNFQVAILNALAGRALTKQALADEVCGGEGSRLYRNGGIKELSARGLIANKRRLGYYRPDMPPISGAEPKMH